MYHHLTVVCKLRLIPAALIHFLQTFERLNKSGITQSRESFHNIRDDLGSNLPSIIKAKVDSGQELRVVFDNFDVRILTDIILSNHRNSDMHWIAQHVTFDRVPSSHLDDSKRCSRLVIFYFKEKFFVSHASASHLRDVYFRSVPKTLCKK